LVKKSADKNKIGSILFGLGALISILGGLIFPGGLNLALSSTLIVLGIIVGLLNITQKETTNFMFASITLVIITSLGGAVLAQVPVIGIYIEGILLSILTFIVPTALIVTLRFVYILAQN